jgi:hypothetical protein
LSNHITFHDAAKNVDENSFDLGMLAKDFEGRLDLSSCSTAAHIKEVCRFTAFKLYNIHRSHGEASPVYHAANISIKSNIV